MLRFFHIASISWMGRRSALLFVVLLTLAGRGVLWAQSESGKETSGDLPLVSVGETKAVPGGSVMVPLYYRGDPATPLSAIVVEVEFVSNSLKSQGAVDGTALESVNGKQETNLTEGERNAEGVARSKLRVTIARAEKTPSEGLPDGLLSYLLFALSPEAKPFTIKLDTKVVSAKDLDDPPNAVSNVNARSGLVEVAFEDMAPAGSCFFFTH